MEKEAAELAAASVGAKTSWVAGIAALLAGLDSNMLAMWAGIGIAFLGFLVNWYYKRKEDKRAEERHEAIKMGWTE